MTAKYIREGIDEGFTEGFREGLKQGFIEGIKECRSKGFDQIEVKEINQVLEFTLETGTNESASDVIKQAVSDEYRSNIGSSFKQEMEDAYYKGSEEIKNANFEVDEIPVSYIKSCVGTSIEKIMECIGSAFWGVKKNLPANMLFIHFFYCLQDEFNKDLGKNLKAYEKTICTEIGKKIKSERFDHERH